MPWTLINSSARACPFCQAVKPSFAQQRDNAAAVVFAELDRIAGEQSTFAVQRVLKGKERLPAADSLTLKLSLPAKAAGLYFLIGEGTADAAYDRWEWSALPVNEASAAYFFRAPGLRTANAERLKYFAKFLEHPEAAVAEDAFLEFGHAPLDEVAQAAESLPMAKLREWLVDPNIPDGRKGFYALALGLAKTDADRRANQKLLREKIAEKKTDFRAGFDGMLAGLLLLEGPPALDFIGERFLNNPNAEVGDVKHAHNAVRFYYEYGKDIPREKIAAAIRPLVERSDTAAAAITDLARWKDWDLLATVAGLYDKPDFTGSDIRTAIIGYLSVCPLPRAAAELDRLRKLDPEGVSAAEKSLSSRSGGK